MTADWKTVRSFYSFPNSIHLMFNELDAVVASCQKLKSTIQNVNVNVNNKMQVYLFEVPFCPSLLPPVCHIKMEESY